MLPVAQYFFFLFTLRNNRRFFFQWLAAHFVAVVPVILWKALALSGGDVIYVVNWIPVPQPVDLPITFFNFTVGYTGGSIPLYFYPGMLAAAVCLIAGAFYALGTLKQNSLHYWFWLSVVPPVIIFSLSLVDFYFYVDRYFVVILPGVILLAVSGAQQVMASMRYGALLLFALIGASAIISVGVTLREGDYVQYDWKATAAYLTRHQAAEDAYMVVPHAFYPSLKHYHQAESIVFLNSQTGFDLGDNEVKRLWVIYRNPIVNLHRQLKPPDFDPFKPTRYAPEDSWAFQFLQSHRDQLVSQHELNGIQILLFEFE